MARLDRLGAVKEVAQLGAVLGREFNYELLRTVWPAEEATLQQGLAALVQTELLYQRGLPPQARYFFKHALIQDAAYQSLLKKQTAAAVPLCAQNGHPQVFPNPGSHRPQTTPPAHDQRSARDDFCCFHDDKRVLSDLCAAIADFLVGLRLRLNEGKSRVRQVKEGVEFLGFVVFPQQLRLNQAAVRRQRRRIRWLQGAYASRMLTWREVVASLQAWNAHAEYGTTWKLRRDVFDNAVFIRFKSP